MDRTDNIIMAETTFEILKCEYNTIFQPEDFGITPTWSNDTKFYYYSTYELKEFQLYLKDFTISSDRGYPAINGVKPEPYYTDTETEPVLYNNIMEPIKYTGAIIVGNQLVKNYGTNDEIPCYCYKLIRELIFQEGKLITTIDHSKAMLRIRKNLDLGLRSLDKKQDVKCIQGFIKASFVGDYNHPNKNDKKKQKRVLLKNAYIKKIVKRLRNNF